MLRMIREGLRDSVCGRMPSECMALNSSTTADGSVAACEVLETAMFCPAYGVELEWTKRPEMFMLYEVEAVDK